MTFRVQIQGPQVGAAMNATSITSRHMIRSRSVPAAAARLMWQIARLPLLAIFTLLEPMVRWICSAALLLGVFTSVVFEFSAAGARFPFLGMLALSLGFGLALFAYYGLLALISR